MGINWVCGWSDGPVDSQSSLVSPEMCPVPVMSSNIIKMALQAVKHQVLEKRRREDKIVLEPV